MRKERNPLSITSNYTGRQDRRLYIAHGNLHQEFFDCVLVERADVRFICLQILLPSHFLCKKLLCSSCHFFPELVLASAKMPLSLSRDPTFPNPASAQYPARNPQASATIDGKATSASSIFFADKIMITITQDGRLAQWVRSHLSAIPKSQQSLTRCTDPSPTYKS